MAILSEETRVLQDINEIVTYKLLNDESADETKSSAVDALDAESVTLLVEASAGVSGGVVTLEGARTSGYTGTWQALDTVTTSAASQVFATTVDISKDPGFPMPYVRARISTVITGGTVDAYLIKRR